jgi:hypothetical protein
MATTVQDMILELIEIIQDAEALVVVKAPAEVPEEAEVLVEAEVLAEAEAQKEEEAKAEIGEDLRDTTAEIVLDPEGNKK